MPERVKLSGSSARAEEGCLLSSGFSMSATGLPSSISDSSSTVPGANSAFASVAKMIAAMSRKALSESLPT